MHTQTNQPRIKMNRRKQFAIALLAATAAIVGAVIAPAPVMAGAYKVYSCQTPAGAPAPTDGWTATGHAPFSSFVNDCRSGGSMRVLLGGSVQTAGSSNVGWGFDSGGARMFDYTIHRSGTSTATGHGTSGLLYTARQHNNPGGSRVVDYCATYRGCHGIGSPSAGVSALNRLSQSSAQLPTDTSAWFITVGCDGFTGYACNPLAGHETHGSVYVHAASFTLADDDAPTVSDARGDLAHGSVLGGQAEIDFVARDSQSGIFRATVEVDGVEAVSVTPNQYSGRCVRQGLAGSTNDFLYRQPCPTTQSVELTLPTTTIADGQHRIRVRVYDAAGNGTTVIGNRQVKVENNPTMLGSNASARFEPDNPARYRTAYGKRRAITGRLVDRQGAPMTDAEVEAFEQLTRAGAMRSRAATFQTDARGRYRYFPPATASRSIELVHAASGGSTSADQIVNSRVQLRAFRSRVPAYGRLILRGKIRSERSLRRVTVEIQAKSGKRWRTVGVRRATVGGAFNFRYRLKRTARANFKFRARVRRTSDLPVIPLNSKMVRVRVGA